MPYANLNRDNAVEVNDGLDSIVIVKDLGDFPGGKTLDVSALGADVKVIRSGHILIQDNKTKVLRPLPVSGKQYASLPEGRSYAGVLKSSISVKNPQAAVLTIGQVNAAASPYPVTEAIKTGLPRIEFLYS